MRAHGSDMSNAARCQISFWHIAKYDSLVMGIFRINNLLRSSLANRHTRTKGESWRAQASDSIGSVQARTVGITSLEWTGGGRQGTDPLPGLERLLPFEEQEQRAAKEQG